MEIEGKDYMEWLHEIRKKMRKEQKKGGFSDIEWMMKINKEVEKILGKKIQKVQFVK